jgi:hypothetical protein
MLGIEVADAVGDCEVDEEEADEIVEDVDGLAGPLEVRVVSVLAVIQSKMVSHVGKSNNNVLVDWPGTVPSGRGPRTKSPPPSQFACANT